MLEEVGLKEIDNDKVEFLQNEHMVYAYDCFDTLLFRDCTQIRF